MNATLMLFLSPIVERFLLVQNPRSLWTVLLTTYSLHMRLLKILVLDSILLILRFVHALIIIRWSCWSLYIMQIMRLRLLSLVCFQNSNLLHQLSNQYLLHQLPNQLKIRDIVTVVPVLLDVTGTTDTIFKNLSL